MRRSYRMEVSSRYHSQRPDMSGTFSGKNVYMEEKRLIKREQASSISNTGD